MTLLRTRFWAQRSIPRMNHFTYLDKPKPVVPQFLRPWVSLYSLPLDVVTKMKYIHISKILRSQSGTECIILYIIIYLLNEIKQIRLSTYWVQEPYTYSFNLPQSFKEQGREAVQVVEQMAYIDGLVSSIAWSPMHYYHQFKKIKSNGTETCINLPQVTQLVNNTVTYLHAHFLFSFNQMCCSLYIRINMGLDTHSWVYCDSWAFIFRSFSMEIENLNTLNLFH